MMRFQIHSVGTGGILFEMFLGFYASYSSRRLWIHLKQEVKDNPHSDVSEVVESIVCKSRNSFYFHLLSCLRSRGTSVNKQLFYLTLIMQHKGLSRSGMQLLGLMNLCLSPRSYDPMLLDHVQYEIEHRRFDDMHNGFPLILMN